MSAVRLLAVGDILVDRPASSDAFEKAAPLLRQADLLFGNCEAVYADGVQQAPSASIPVICEPENAKALGRAGFDVMSLANNHTVDGGYEGLLQTLGLLRDQRIATCGAGADVAEARTPAVLHHDGTAVAFLGYSCVYPAGYAAGEERPGVAAVRTHTVYAPSELDAFQSGGAPSSFTVVNPRDLQQVRDDIEAARARADVVVVSVHAGDGSQPAVLMDYERDFARACIDAGATVVLGHHHHMLRGAELYHGGAILYGLGHFVFDVRDFESLVPARVLAGMREHAGEYGYWYREGYPLLPMHPEARMTVVAVCDLDAAGRPSIGVVPCVLTPEGQPVPLQADQEEGSVVVDYLHGLNERAGLSSRWQLGDRTVGGFRVLDLVESPAH
ncbi:MAG: CapA family protein [Nocardioidaceae bacterium]|nr:CapA family protein [Nocardioidaceae bacterium]